MRICIVSFSARKNGNCASIGNYIRGIHCGPASLFSFADFSITSCGGCDYECFTKNLSCPYMDDMACTLIDNILSHDLTYYIVPNYCDYPCANFFAFCERQQCCFQHNPGAPDAYEKARKKFIVLSNTNQDNFYRAFSSHVTQAPAILFLSAKRYGKISLSGDILSSEEAREDIEKFVLG